MGRVRDYREIVERLEALPRRHWRVERVGEVWGYPFFRVRRESGRRAATVLLSAGIHGEEPAGVEAALRWLEGAEWARWPVNWWVLSCINPYGWERHQRGNAWRQDINRQFRNASGCPEAGLIKRLVAGRRFLFSMEFHEDEDAPGYYLYELRRQPPYAGEEVVAAVSRVVPINAQRSIDGNRVTRPGLIRRDPARFDARRRRRWPMAFYLFAHGTDHVLGSETSQRPTWDRRARAHLVALRAALPVVMSAAGQ